MVYESRNEEINHIIFGSFITGPLQTLNMQSDFCKPLPGPGPVLVLFLLSFLVQSSDFSVQLDVLGFFTLAKEDIYTFVIQIHSLFRQPFAVPMDNGNHCK